jgi:hypothetical protein
MGKVIKITKTQAEALLQFKANGLDLLTNYCLMCQGWSEDNDYQELDEEMLNEDGTIDDDYYNFELWEK